MNYQYIILSIIMVLLVSCGTVPLPLPETTEAKPPAPAPHVVQPQIAQQQVPAQPGPVTEQGIGEAKPYNPDASGNGLSPMENRQRAVQHLQRGEPEQARNYINAMLKFNPDDAQAKSLLMQIDKPPHVYLGRQSFSYRTRPGDNLADLARRFLGDRLKFYGLARYNKLSDPRKLRVGQTILIPGARPPSIKPQRSEGTKLYLTAKRYYDSGQFVHAIDILESHKAKKYRTEKLMDLLVLTYTARSKQLVKKADLINALSILKKAVEIQPKNPELQRQYAKVKGEVEAEEAWDKAIKARENGEYNKAYLNFRIVLKFRPNNKEAFNNLAQLKPQVIEKPYRECVFAYRHHKLNKAIRLCSGVTQLEPDHDQAKLYLAKAKHLKGIIDKENKKNRQQSGSASAN